ncbi:MAG: 16S rRNA (cytosine(967)-C(5))-methyltransferase RsmB [Magnetococcales bacterium]|nr:16S rRNA (cytosine(967)-C(5))-methyltransferase RsmB [Magnetococcales bacterium]
MNTDWPHPRQLAIRALLRVTRDHHPLDDTLERLLATTPNLPPRDRALVFAIVIGTIRHLTLLDHLLRACMQHPLAERRQESWAILRTALFQIRFLRIPTRAAIHEAVNLAKKGREQALAGFINAVLRRAANLDADALLATLNDPITRLAIEHAHPRWLVERWLTRLGEPATRHRLQTGNQPGPLTLRINTLATTRARMAEALGAQGIEVENCLRSPQGLRLPGRVGRIDALPGFAEGWFMVQDEAAQWVSILVDPQPGERLLDACAAPGGKTLHLAELARGQATIIAVEKRPERLPALAENIVRLHAPGIRVASGDATNTAFLQHALAGETVDAALVDAPCSATGILRRHPDIKWRRQPGELTALVAEQQRLLAAIATQVRPGGRLIYATCSLEPEENAEQIATFLATHPTWRRWPIDPRQAGLDPTMITAAGDFAVEPDQEGMDGFFAARLQRQS